MRMVSYLLERARGALATAALANILNASASAGLMALIHHLVSPEAVELPFGGMPQFAGLLVVIFASGLASQLALIRMAARAAFDIRLWLARRVMALPLADLERLGKERVYACLTQDVASLSNAWIGLPVAAFHAAVLIGGSIYLAWLSLPMFLVLAVAMLTCGFGYQRLAGRGRMLMARFRERQDALYRHFEALLRGAKELRSNRRRAEQLLREDLEPDTRALRELQLEAFGAWAVGTNWGNVLTLAAVGVLLMTARTLGGELANASLGFVLAILFLRAHIGSALNVVPVLVQGDVALRKIEDLGLSEVELPEPTTVPVARDWRQLELSDVTFSYDTADGSFHLGPLNLALHRAEIVFVTGGNGSGKSTFAKLLVGLYAPESGEILLDGKPIATDSEAYRSRFSVLFADFFLFQHLTTRTGPEVETEALRYLHELGLHKKVEPSMSLQRIPGLSAGEQRRLALVSAYLEGGDIYVFDEWAADQDPRYRAAFYHEILPGLRLRGRTVVVITHDDRYFHCADRLLKFEEGRAIWLRPPPPPAA
jgi:cyclic peptide transporter